MLTTSPMNSFFKPVAARANPGDGATRAAQADVSDRVQGRCKCGYHVELEHAGDREQLSFFPFFCEKCSAVKGVLALRGSEPGCPDCLKHKIISYGEEPLKPALVSKSSRAGGAGVSGDAHFCPQCKNTSLHFCEPV